MRLLRLPLLCLSLLAAGAPATAQPAASAQPGRPVGDAALPDPFAGFESLRLANGMKLWYRHMPGATLASMAVIVPYGRDHDPPGREQTAHLLEHVLLSDRAGRAEAELIRELTARGGSFGGVTGPHYTLFPVTVESAHAAFGVQWLHDVVAPRIFPEDLVERNREPVIVEMQGRRRPLLRGTAARMLDHPRLHPPAFWQREFGYPAHEERGVDELASLARITGADLRAFYDRYYAPPAMTLVIIAGTPLRSLQPVIDATFGSLPWRPPPAPIAARSIRQEPGRRIVHTLGGNTRYTLTFRLDGIDGRDNMRLMFIEDLLRQRLTERLRSGSVKSVYGVTTTTEVRGTAAWFAILIDMNPRHEEQVRAAVDRELARLGRAAADSTAFYSDRDALSRTLRTEHASPGALRAWTMRRAWRPDLWDTFPDVGAYYASVGPDSIAAFASRTFTPERSITAIARPLPVHPLLLLLLACCAAAAGVALYRRIALRPVDMNAVRYIARLRAPLPVRVIAGVAATAAAVGALRLAVAAVHLAAERWILTRDSFILAAAAGGLLLFAAAFTCSAIAGLLRSKVLIFDDEIRLKSPTYRATLIPGNLVAAAGRAGPGRPARLRRPALRTGSAVALELRDGSGYVLHVRDPDGLIRALDALRTRAAGAPATADSAVVETRIPSLL